MARSVKPTAAEQRNAAGQPIAGRSGCSAGQPDRERTAGHARQTI